MTPPYRAAELDPRRLAERLQNEGFAICAEVVDADTLTILTAACEELQQAEEGVLRRGGSAYGIRNVLRRSPVFARLALSEALRALVVPVLGPDAVPVRGLVFDKTPEANWHVPWHQDLTLALRRRVELPGYTEWSLKSGVPHVRPPVSVLERMLAVRVHLDDCDTDNGALRVIPGSHRHGRFSDAEVAAWQESRAAVTCPAQRGDVLLMHPLLLHASAPATHPQHRRVLHLEYAAVALPAELEWADAPEPA